jgi:hypothetical protein
MLFVFVLMVYYLWWYNRTYYFDADDDADEDEGENEKVKMKIVYNLLLPCV